MSLHTLALQKTIFENLAYTPISDGNAAFFNNARVVNGIMTEWLADGVRSGDIIRPSGSDKDYFIETVLSSEVIRLTEVFEEPSCEGAYIIQRDALPLLSIAETPVPVYDLVPEENDANTFPYVTINDIQATNISPKDFDMHEYVVNIMAWSNQRGSAEVRYLDSQIYDLLNRKNPDIYNSCIADINHEFQTTVIESDGITLHSVNRFRVIVQDDTRRS